MPYHIKPHMKKMTTPPPPHTSSLLLFLLLAASVIHGAAAAEDLIKKTCKVLAKEDTNVQYGFCAAALEAAPASGCATLRGLTSISIRLIRYNVTDTRCRIKQMLKEKSPRRDRYTELCLRDCLEMYSDSISDVKAAMKEYNSGRLADASVHLSAVLDAASTCEDGFEERRGLVSPLKKRNNDTIQLSAMALTLVHDLQTAGPKH
ncbi:hypothetical protein DM860_001316 [Cuscuta australis]|uniref:Pectinesterase inhibitor domain-containing protein n=1 Tax=Cuscuta australis TaxID=267555 RepID=A0A328DUH5_9ASTE|nr:hypothetical protein DM860_001316 [Cuscuta australis]